MDITRNIFALASSLSMFAGGGYLIWQIYKHNSIPSLGARITFIGIAIISIAAFLADGNKNLVGAVVLITDLIMSSVVAVAIIKRYGLAVSLERFERYYLLGAFVILIIWFLTKDAFLAFVLLQVLVITGYAPVIQKMFKHRRNTESSPAWILFLVSFLIGSYPAYTAWRDSGEILSLIYVLRGLVCLCTVIAVGLYFDWRKKSALNSSRVA